MGTLKTASTRSWPTTEASRIQTGAAPQVLDHHRLVLRIGLQVGAFAEVVLDLGQQLHGGVGGRDPSRWAVRMDQGAAGPVDLKDGPGGLGDPEQPGQQVIGLGQGRPQLADGPGDQLTVHSHWGNLW